MRIKWNLAGLIGSASERRTGLSETDIVPQIFFHLLGHQDRAPHADSGAVRAAADCRIQAVHFE